MTAHITQFRVPVRRAQPQTLVLVHASASSARQWDRLRAALGDEPRVHAVDLHGHGAQPPWSGPRGLTLDDEVDRLQSLLADAGPLHLVGHSYGGAVALQLALRAPQRVRSLALYEPVLLGLLMSHEADGPGAHELLGLTAGMRRLLAQRRAPLAAERFVDYWSGAGSWERLDDTRRDAVTARVPLLLQHFDALRAQKAPPAALARLTMPTLCLHGSRSTLAAQRIAALLRHALPAARHETMAGLGHMGPVTHAAAVNLRLVHFLQHEAVPPRPTAPREHALGVA